jgi:hypothetical protein
MDGMVTKINRSKNSKRAYVLGLVALLAIAGGIYAYHVSHDKKPIATVNQYTKGQVDKAGGSSTTSDTPSSEKTPDASASLVAPAGNFVSNHHPNLGGSPAPNTMTSVCNTSPGASCQISFTQDGTTKSLPAQVTDAGGATFWDWKLQDVGLGAGEWKITATSKVGDKSLSATDPMPLVVSQ